MEEVLRILDIYAEVAEDIMAMPVIKGVKTRAEKFAGALRSYSIEAMMQNGLALQAGTSHDLGQNFGKAFNVQFQSKEGQARLRVADQLGREHAADRRPDYEPLRRQGAGAAAQAGACESGAGADLSQGRGEGPGAGSGAANRERSGREGGRSRRARRRARSFSTGSGAACRWFWNWVRAIWRRATSS